MKPLIINVTEKIYRAKLNSLKRYNIITHLMGHVIGAGNFIFMKCTVTQCFNGLRAFLCPSVNIHASLIFTGMYESRWYEFNISAVPETL